MGSRWCRGRRSPTSNRPRRPRAESGTKGPGIGRGGWCFLQVQAQGMYLSLGARLLPLGIWHRTVWSYLVQAIINGCVLCLCAFKMHRTVWSYLVQAIIHGCVLCLCAFKMHLLAYGWCLHTFFFRDKARGEDSATPSE